MAENCFINCIFKTKTGRIVPSGYILFFPVFLILPIYALVYLSLSVQGIIGFPTIYTLLVCFSVSYFDCEFSLLAFRYFTNDLAINLEFVSVCLSKMSKYSSIEDIIYFDCFSMFPPNGASFKCSFPNRLYY